MLLANCDKSSNPFFDNLFDLFDLFDNFVLFWREVAAGRCFARQTTFSVLSTQCGRVFIPILVLKTDPSGWRSERSVGDPLPTSSSDLTVRHPRAGFFLQLPSGLDPPPTSRKGVGRS